MKIIYNIIKQFQGTLTTWKIYWKTYGGFSSIISSTYFISAILFTFICFPAWMKENNSWAWFNLCNSILPNILVFTLGGYIILSIFGDNKFIELLAGDKSKNAKPSPFMVINTTFLHFIIIQIIALLFSIISLVWNFKTGFIAFLGFLLFSYAIILLIATSFIILRVVKWYNDFITNKKNK